MFGISRYSEPSELWCMVEQRDRGDGEEDRLEGLPSRSRNTHASDPKMTAVAAA